MPKLNLQQAKGPRHTPFSSGILALTSGRHVPAQRSYHPCPLVRARPCAAGPASEHSSAPPQEPAPSVLAAGAASLDQASSSRGQLSELQGPHTDSNPRSNEEPSSSESLGPYRVSGRGPGPGRGPGRGTRATSRQQRSPAGSRPDGAGGEDEPPSADVQQRQGGASKDLYEGRYTVQQLAYLGDAIWSLHVRCRYLLPPKNFAMYRTMAERHVTAQQQAAYLACLQGGRPTRRGGAQQQQQQQRPQPQAVLTAQEVALVRWAASPARMLSVRSKHRAQGGGQEEAYRQATAFEALLGYLSLEDGVRMNQLLELLGPHMDAHDASQQQQE